MGYQNGEIPLTSSYAGYMHHSSVPLLIFNPFFCPVAAPSAPLMMPTMIPPAFPLNPNELMETMSRGGIGGNLNQSSAFPNANALAAFYSNLPMAAIKNNNMGGFN